ncbi:MAG: tetratricopeptide repeat protein [Candidatus Thermoplasmatota archaeon]|nr:tetratricopeptide repeat protein [Candidatus Thermoplasmatota archaeon]
MKDGKRNNETMTTQRLYDTSKCQVKFRKPRILQDRKRNFDHQRELGFDPNRLIYARLQGVIFRSDSAVGFRNIGIGNIEFVKDRKDWPDVGPAEPPEMMKVQRDHDWERTWGMDETFEARWGGRRRTPSRDYLYSQDRIKPQLSYYSQKKPVPPEPPVPRNRSRQVQGPGQKPSPRPQPATPPSTRPKPRVEVVHEAVHAQTRNKQVMTAPASTTRTVNPKDQKRAFAFNEYALALMESGEYERAMDYFQKALDLDPSEQTYSINMMRCREWLDYKERGGRR